MAIIPRWNILMKRAPGMKLLGCQHLTSDSDAAERVSAHTPAPRAHTRAPPAQCNPLASKHQDNYYRLRISRAPPARASEREGAEREGAGARGCPARRDAGLCASCQSAANCVRPPRGGPPPPHATPDRR
ncbi:hypothetical protein EVAR_43195_1 [Eumeta japonica]|uniref:Uncharacterized protein n=1 Tax=Eumeta variegata TaxID=151549 RepID=A0A4C1WTI4_EUMVA|nr:hypothetical protein EVAR_43195_1 [Eumeta japonica]